MTNGWTPYESPSTTVLNLAEAVKLLMDSHSNPYGPEGDTARQLLRVIDGIAERSWPRYTLKAETPE